MSDDDGYRRNGDGWLKWIAGITATLLVVAVGGGVTTYGQMKAIEAQVSSLADSVKALQAATAYRYTSGDAARDRDSQSRRDDEQDRRIEKIDERMDALSNRLRAVER